MNSDQPQPAVGEPRPQDPPPRQDPSDRYRIAVDGSDARDEALARQVHVRTADAAGADALQREARFLARIEHGAIPALYDFQRGADSAVLVTRQVRGITLAEAIADARAGTVCPELCGSVPAMQAMLRVCDALAAAHAKGVVHRRLTPAAITLALHGEVLVGGWEAALAHAESPLSGRFTSLDPLDALHGMDDLHVDIRAVGACLFEALVRRAPTPGRDPFADVGRAEGALLSPRVCAVIRCALRSDKSGGYRNIDELRRALDRCIAEELAETGATAIRYRPLRRWIGWSAAAACIAAAAAAAWMLPHWRNPGDSWRTVVAREDFSDDSWRVLWSGSDAWTQQNGRLVSSARDSARLTLRQRVNVPMAIEYTARIDAGQRPGDLSVVWSESGADGEGTGQRAVSGARTFSIQAGAYDNSYCGIFMQPGDRRLAHSTLKLEPGRDYRFRVEIDGGRFSMAIDGRTVLEHRDRFPSTSGYVSLLGWYPGKSFDDVVVFAKPVVETVPAAATGDALYGFGHYDDAAAMYGRLAEGADIDGHLAQDALFRKGLAERRAGRMDDSSETWSRLTDPELAQAADCLRLEDLIRTGQYDLFLERLRAYWRRSGLVRPELRLQWSAAASAAAASTAGPQIPEAFAEALLRLRDELFPTDAITGFEASRVLLRLERYEDVLRLFPDEIRARIGALVALGRYDELDRMPYLNHMDRLSLNMARGRFEAVVEMSDPASYHRAFAICKLGRAAELTGTFAVHPALLHLGRAEQLLAVRPLNPVAANECLLALGRFEQAAGAGVPDLPGSGRDATALAILGRADEAEQALGRPLPWLRLMLATAAGDPAAAQLRAAVQAPRSMGAAWFPGMVAAPLCDLVAGRPESFDAAMRTMAAGWQQYHGQRAWLLARAVLGEADEKTVLAMPAATEARAWWLLASALRAERAGKSDEARQAYDAFIALPGQLRLLDGNSLNAPVECLVRWRQRALAR